MDDYKALITGGSRDFTAKERIALKDVTECEKLDEIIQPGQPIFINPIDYAYIEIHNEKSSNKDYKVLVVIDEDGTRFSTSSESFMSAFENLWDDATDLRADGEDFRFKLYKKESKNFKGKYFLTCGIA